MTGFENAPAEVREIVFALRDGLQNTLKTKLLGLYLYGSLAYHCFNPEMSDIDFVVVLTESPTFEEEQELSQLHKRLGDDPNYGNRLEGIYLTEEQVNTEHDFPSYLYSVDGKKFVKAKEGERDPDFPMHRQHLHESAIRITGAKAQELFYPVPREILKRSLDQEVLYIKEQFEKRPVYAVLNLCRIVRAYETHTLSSKKQGGEWALKHLPFDFHEIIVTALKGYANQITDEDKKLIQEKLPMFYSYCTGRIRRLTEN